MKKTKLISTDGNKDEIVTDNPRYVQFAKDMEAAGIPWRSYSGRGMNGEYCPAAVTDSENDVSERIITTATKVKNLRSDTLGYHFVVYP